MIKVFINYEGKTSEITEFITDLSISGSLSEVSRSVNCSIIYPMLDRFQSKNQISPGTHVWIHLDNQEIFRGIVIDRDLNSSDSLSFTAYDYAYYLTRNTITKNFKNITADNAVKQLLREIDLKHDYIISSAIKINYIMESESVYEGIQNLYKQVGDMNHKEYFTYMNRDKVCVGELGREFAPEIIRPCRDVFTGDGNMLSFQYRDSMDSMINKVIIYDENNNYKGVVQNDYNIKHYGTLQDNYTVEEKKDPYIVARNMMSDIEREFNCEVVGDYNYITGKSVYLRLPNINHLNGAIMHIIGDSHTWDMDSGKFFTQLQLKYVRQIPSEILKKQDKQSERDRLERIRLDKKRVREEELKLSELRKRR